MTSAPFSASPSDVPPSADPLADPSAGERTSAPAGPPARPQLRRSGTDRMIGGVCGGLADYSGIDALLWRVGFVGLTLAGGSGILVYLLLWVLMPSAPLPADTWPSPVERLVERLHGAIDGAVATARRD
jgi:phage shock protein PspC (stress-responsive transcriptional regulator)